MRAKYSREFEELFQYQSFVQRLAQGLAREDGAEDLAQEAWLIALRKPPQVTHDSPRRWLRRVVTNLAWQRRRSDLRRRWRESKVAQHRWVRTAPDEAFDRESLLRQVQKAVQELREPYRSAVSLRFFAGLSQQEVADRLGVPLETVRSQLKRGVALLREKLKSRVTRSGEWWWGLLLTPLHELEQVSRPWRSWRRKLSVGVVIAGLGGAFLLGLKVRDGSPEGNRPAAVEPAPERQIVAEVTPLARDAIDFLRSPWDDSVPLSADRVGSQSIRGVVVGPDGQPVPAAQILFADPECNPAVNSQQEFARRGMMVGRMSRCLRTQTDAAGRFQISMAFPRFGWSLAAVHARHGWRLLTGLDTWSRDHARELTLQLGGGNIVRGEVLDGQLNPLSGARLQVTGCWEEEGQRRTAVVADLSTDEAGRFVTPALEFERVEIEVAAPGFRRLHREFLAGGQDQQTFESRFVLARADRFGGHLNTPFGVEQFRKALDYGIFQAGWRLRVMVLAPGQELDACRLADVYGTPVQVLDQADSLSYSVEERPPAGSQLVCSVGVFVLGVATVPPAGPLPDIDLNAELLEEFIVAASLRLRVVDAQSGESLPAFSARYGFWAGQGSISIFRPQEVVFEEVRSWVQLPDLVQRAYLLKVEADGFAPLTCPLDLRESALSELVLQLSRARHDLQVEVRKAQGHQVRRSRLQLLRANGAPVEFPVTWRHACKARSVGRGGLFCFEDLAPGRYLLKALPLLDALEEPTGSATRWVDVPAQEVVQLTLPDPQLVLLAPELSPNAASDEDAARYQVRIRDPEGSLVRDDLYTGLVEVGAIHCALAPGDYSVEIYRPGCRSLLLDLTVPHGGAVRFSQEPH
jgi:RNA polymerase sigma-70 factor (ECF subfamily)